MKAALLFLIAYTIIPVRAEAFSYDMERIRTVYHEAPSSFSVGANGATGTTVSGRTFAQRSVIDTPSVRLQRFEIDSAYWYVSDKGIIWADTDMEALSQYLSRVHA